MSHDETHRTDRRTFLQAGAAATAAAASLAPGASAQQATAKADATAVLPKRKLGKTGVEVTLLEQGGVRNDTDRILRFSFARGIRLFDTATDRPVLHGPLAVGLPPFSIGFLP